MATIVEIYDQLINYDIRQDRLDTLIEQARNSLIKQWINSNSIGYTASVDIPIPASSAAQDYIEAKIALYGITTGNKGETSWELNLTSSGIIACSDKYPEVDGKKENLVKAIYNYLIQKWNNQCLDGIQTAKQEDASYTTSTQDDILEGLSFYESTAAYLNLYKTYAYRDNFTDLVNDLNSLIGAAPASKPTIKYDAQTVFAWDLNAAPAPHSGSWSTSTNEDLKALDTLTTPATVIAAAEAAFWAAFDTWGAQHLFDLALEDLEALGFDCAVPDTVYEQYSWITTNKGSNSWFTGTDGSSGTGGLNFGLDHKLQMPSFQAISKPSKIYHDKMPLACARIAAAAQEVIQKIENIAYQTIYNKGFKLDPFDDSHKCMIPVADLIKIFDTQFLYNEQILAVNYALSDYAEEQHLLYENSYDYFFYRYDVTLTVEIDEGIEDPPALSEMLEVWSGSWSSWPIIVGTKMFTLDEAADYGMTAAAGYKATCVDEEGTQVSENEEPAALNYANYGGSYTIVISKAEEEE